MQNDGPRCHDGDNLEIAATGAIAKNGKEGEVRVIFDGSHGCSLNPGIRVRDQVKYPTSSDGKAVLGECAEEGGPHYGVHIDFKGAHRQMGVVRRTGAARPARSVAQPRRRRSQRSSRRPWRRGRTSRRMGRRPS